MELHQSSAKILQFPATARNAVHGFAQKIRFANEVAEIRRAKAAVPTTAWYHDEAIGEDDRHA